MSLRETFKMKLYLYELEEYVERHNPIWPELESALKSLGVHNYRIFFDEETHSLFSYAQIASEENWKAIAGTEVYKKWWPNMTPMMETNSDTISVSVDLNEVVYMH